MIFAGTGANAGDAATVADAPRAADLPSLRYQMPKRARKSIRRALRRGWCSCPPIYGGDLRARDGARVVSKEAGPKALTSRGEDVGLLVMSPFEYLLLFAAIILGLAITYLALSLHRLLGAGRRVRWDWLAPLAALVAFLKIVTQWWSWYGVEGLAGGLTFEMFVLVLVASVLLFLMAATALPDEAAAEVVDLRQHYSSVFRRFWLLFTAHWVLITGLGLWVQVAVGKAHLSLLSPVWLVLPVALSLVFIRARWWHTVALVAFACVYVPQLSGLKDM